jgi:hypothetical protein
MKDNEDLDYDEIYPPVGRVLEGMELLEQLNAEYEDLKDTDGEFRQGHLHTKGQAYLDEHFPEMSYIATARIQDPADWREPEPEAVVEAVGEASAGQQEQQEQQEQEQQHEKVVETDTQQAQPDDGINEEL